MVFTSSRTARTDENSSHTGGSVVVPSIAAPSSVAVCRSLGRRGIGVIALAESEDTAAARSRYCRETRIGPSPEEDFGGYVETLLELAARPDVRTIVPVREEDVYALAKHREEFAAHVATPWPTLRSLRRVQDRLTLADVAARAGVATPETRSFDEWVHWDRRTILKARYSVLANGYVESRPVERVGAVPKTTYLDPGVVPDRTAVVDRMGHVPIAQEYVPNTDEYGFFALYDRGEAVATFQHRQIRGYRYCGGPSAYRESVSIPELERSGRTLLDALEWHGLAMVEFLYDEATDTFELMEVNPRFWSSLPFSVRAGADFPYYYWQLATGAREAIECAYEPKVGGHLLRGEAIYLYSVLAEEYPLVERPRFTKALWDVASSIVRQPRFDYLVADDPLPFVRDLRNAVSSVWSRGDDEAGRDPRRPPSGPSVEREGESEQAEREPRLTADGGTSKGTEADGRDERR